MDESDQFSAYLDQMLAAGIEKLDQMRDDALQDIEDIYDSFGSGLHEQIERVVVDGDELPLTLAGDLKLARVQNEEELAGMHGEDGLVVWVEDEQKYWRHDGRGWIPYEVPGDAAES